MQGSETSRGLRAWRRSGAPWIWLNAAAMGAGILALAGLFVLLAVRGLGHFWPGEVIAFDYRAQDGEQRIVGELAGRETISRDQYLEAVTEEPEALARIAHPLPAADADASRKRGRTVGMRGAPPCGPRDHAGRRLDALATKVGERCGLDDPVERWLVKTGNRREAAPDFRWVFAHRVKNVTAPRDVIVFERAEWGNAYGFLNEIAENGRPVSGGPTWLALTQRIERARRLRAQIDALQDSEINEIDRRLERLRLERRRRALDGLDRVDDIEALETRLRSAYRAAAARRAELSNALGRDEVSIRLMDGGEAAIRLGSIIRAWQPNSMTTAAKLGHYLESLWGFLSDAPREANTEGGVFPAIFGTVMMVLVMSVLVTPFGVIAALYLREYAHQGSLVRAIRIAVHNLAGVPSIVYGVFGLGFFVYAVGGTVDDLFFPEARPAPTFGTPGLLWASLTLALLTVPVVIVSTEEGLTRIPRRIREGSLALGATQAETIFRMVLPMASPSILTGLILAVARAAGEVAPLMLVGVVKLAPALPVDGSFPFIHLERKFMHLGFHIYDLGFQSPNVVATRPLVFATALLLIAIVVVLNLCATWMRNRLEARYRTVEN